MFKLKFSFNNIIQVVCLICNVLFLIIHLFYSIIFLIAKSDLLVYVNIISSLFYVGMFLLIYKNKYSIYSLVVGLEITSYMTFATIYVGIRAGFHICFIGLCSLAFVTKYFLKDSKIIINPVIISLIFMTDYVFLYFYNKHNAPYVVLEEYIYVILYISHVAIVFSFIIIFLFLLIQYVFKLEVKIRKESEIDKLTQLGNRKALSTYYEALGDQKSNYAVAIFDIDDFKQLNDIHGHLCGDYVLKEIAGIAKTNSLDDFVSRWGGEEFVIISKIDNDLQNTVKKIDQIRNRISQFNFEYNSKELHPTITIGVASYNNDETLDAWIDRADEKLYEGKNKGKNRIVT